MDYTLSDLIEQSVLDSLRDSFSIMTGCAACIRDNEGNCLNSGIDISQTVIPYECDELPVMVDDIRVGTFVYGITRDQKESELPAQAEERMTYVNSASKVINSIVRNSYRSMQASMEIERAANMKADFLANMSHEIRTPMNAVIGMAELALRENLPDSARDYIKQIRTSGQALLAIINDILDFSKIESGKMDIIPVEYEPLSMYNDVANIVATRLKDKRVELLLDVDPTFPTKLYGDDVRIRQILINLANNAAKFTRKGMVKIIFEYEKVDEENILMRIAVEDTGCGIKEEDINKIFDAFQQIDSKRNRNIEGTGLGLAIVRNLLDMMGGELKVTSEYGKGSTFTVELPQKVLDWTPAVTIRNKEDNFAFGYFVNKYIAKAFFKNTKALGIRDVAIVAPDRFEQYVTEYVKECHGKQIYLFTEEDAIEDYYDQYVNKFPNLTVVELVDFFSNRKVEKPNWCLLRKPLSVINMASIINREELRGSKSKQAGELNFTAPEAKILIVDDNAINLAVAEGLLEPLKAKVYTITRGKEAIELLEQHHFDIVFMDHLMPELDGVETTRLIRRFHPECDDIPIIALTANVVEGTREMFLAEGMNDLVPKPIDVGLIVEAIRKWLPPEKIVPSDGTATETAVREKEEIVIGDLDTDSARNLLGSDALFWKILKGYYKSIPEKAKLIAQLKQQQDWPAYTIEVHALKSISRQIGAIKLSKQAAELEKAGSEEDVATISQYTDAMLQLYTSYIPVLAPFCEEREETATGKAYDAEALRTLLGTMKEAIDNLDMDEMERIVEELKGYEYDAAMKKQYQALADGVDSMDVDVCLQIVNEWEQLI